MKGADPIKVSCGALRVFLVGIGTCRPVGLAPFISGGALQ